MQNQTESRFLTAKQICEIMQVSPSTAYKIIRKLNHELEAKGMMLQAAK